MKKSELDRQIQKKLEKLKRFRLLDDTFMSKVFESKACVELLLRIILGIPDLVVIECRTQYELKNLQGRSIRLDIYARVGNRYFNIEIQRDERGVFKRARYHCALVDANILEPGESFENLPESYVIFITEKDVLGEGLPIYHVNRVVEETQKTFKDDSHIVYVNAQCVNEKTDLGKLMADFHCTKAEEMHYPVLAERVQYFKEKKEGVSSMCQIMEEILEEGRAEGRAKGRTEGRTEGRAEGEVRMIMNLMKSMELPMEKAMDILKVSAKDRKAYAPLVAKKLKKQSK